MPKVKSGKPENIFFQKDKPAPVIVEPAVAPIIYGDVVMIEVKPDMVWCHVLTRHDYPNGPPELHRQAVIVLTPHAFAAALKSANLAALRVVDGEADH